MIRNTFKLPVRPDRNIDINKNDRSLTNAFAFSRSRFPIRCVTTARVSALSRSRSKSRPSAPDYPTAKGGAASFRQRSSARLIVTICKEAFAFGCPWSAQQPRPPAPSSVTVLRCVENMRSVPRIEAPSIKAERIETCVFVSRTLIARIGFFTIFKVGGAHET